MAGSVNKAIAESYAVEQLSIPQIAATQSIPLSRVRKILIDEGVRLRTRAEGLRLRTDVLGQHMKGKKRVFSKEWKAKISSSKKRHGEKYAKGFSKKPNGYVEYTRGPHKGRSVHVVAMESRLGRKLQKGEVVHHIDGVRDNNADNNLALMTRSGHQRLHKREQSFMKRNS